MSAALRQQPSVRRLLWEARTECDVAAEVAGVAGEFLKRLSEHEDADWSQFDNWDPKVQDALIEFMTQFLPTSDWSEITSPIEQLLYLALEQQGWTLRYLRPTNGTLVIHPQVPFEANGRKYRVDFFVGALIDGDLRGVVVECDGHAFHEKTKAQAAKDKKRDRDLQMVGNVVLHYTGSEIWANPYKCAEEILNTLIQRKR